MKALKIYGLTPLSLFLLLIFFLSWFIFGWKYHSFFDQNLWLNGIPCTSDWDCTEKNDIPCIRGSMVGDLKLRYLNMGMTRNEIELLLGTDYRMHKRTKTCMDYDLGMCSGLKLDYDSLALCLDDKDKLIDIFTVQH